MTTSNVPALRIASEEDEAKFLHKMASGATLRWMDEVIGHHEKAAEELRRHREQFRRAADAQRHAEGEQPTPVEVLAWFVNANKFETINSRIDLAVNHAAALSSAAAKLGG